MKGRREKITGLPPGWWDEGSGRLPILTHRPTGLSVSQHIDYPAGFWLARTSGRRDSIEIGVVPVAEALETGARLVAEALAVEAAALMGRSAAFEELAAEVAAFGVGPGEGGS